MSVPLWLVRKDLGISLGQGLPYVLARDVTSRQMLFFCGYYRRMGIAELFMSGQVVGFVNHLSRSAHAFVFYLEGLPVEHKVTSRSEPFFDAIACANVKAAQAIAQAARATWNPDEEYEEDFLYMRLLMDGFALERERGHLDALLKRYEQVVASGADLRLELCRALLQSDQQLFDETLERLIGEHRRENEKKLEQEQISPNDMATVLHLWVELLALLRFAERAKLKVARDYPLAPSLARRVESTPLPAPDAWRHIPSFLDLG